MLISNHSYGTVAGWHFTDETWQWAGNPDISDKEDWKFGFYNSNAQTWDEIAYNSPYYLIVKAAGNERNLGPTNREYPPNGSFDCISTSGVAKNILTVGAIEKLDNGYTGNPAEVIMSSFSSWGPADDGRIKPDICGMGVNVFSLSGLNDNAYKTYSGTSMATPNITGSLILLQQLYNQLYSKYMKSATLKALVIHTADEAGSAIGPDYKFGWGILNSLTCANYIANKGKSVKFYEKSYTDGNHNYNIKVSGKKALTATLVWTDVKANPTEIKLDPSEKMLVNDLNISISDGQNTYYPYKLDKNNPNNPATTGVNDIDNVEKIFIQEPDSTKNYKITISHKGNIINNKQDYSLIISGIKPDTSYFVNFKVGSQNKVIQNAKISINGFNSIFTNSKGIAQINDIDNGNYTYSIEAENFTKIDNGSFTVENTNKFINIIMDTITNPNYYASFKVSNGDSPINNATIIIKNVDSLKTNTEGKAKFINLSAGTYNYEIKANGFNSYKNTLNLNQNTNTNIQMQVESSSKLKIYVSSEFENLPKTKIKIYSPISLEKLTNDNGEVEFELNEGYYMYYVTKQNYINYNTSKDTTYGSVIIKSKDIYKNYIFKKNPATSITDNDEIKLNIYPNPFINNLKVTSNSLIEKVTIIDILGTEIYKHTVHQKTHNIDTSNLYCGIYTIKITLKNGKEITKKIIKVE
jgi:hypothetical protein